MKLIVSRKNSVVHGNSLTESAVLSAINSGFGNNFRVMPAEAVPEYIEAQAKRGYVCYEFDHAGTYQSQTTIIKSKVA